MHISLIEFKFCPDPTTNSEVICSSASKQSMYNVLTTLALSFLIGSFSFLQLSRELAGLEFQKNMFPLFSVVIDLFLFKLQITRECIISWMDSKVSQLEPQTADLYINPYFERMVNQIYPPELQLNKANTSDTEAPFLDLHLSIYNGFVSSKIYYKDDDSF